MTIKHITRPADYTPAELLGMIESSKDSFTEGRRNNDIVNWVFANMLKDLEEHGWLLPWQAYVKKFKDLMVDLTADQKEALDRWDDDYPVDKVRAVIKFYDHIDSPSIIYGLWLPMDYEVLGA